MLITKKLVSVLHICKPTKSFMDTRINSESRSPFYIIFETISDFGFHYNNISRIFTYMNLSLTEPV